LEKELLFSPKFLLLIYDEVRGT